MKNLAATCLLLSLVPSAFAGSMFIGELTLVEQYAPAVNGSGAMCFVRVAAAGVQGKAACASVSGHYYYAWECEDPRRKGFTALGLAAYLAGRKVQLIGSGQCSPHPSYENLDYFIITDTP